VPPAFGRPQNDCPEALLLLLARGPKSLPRPVANLNLAANLRAADSVLLGALANLIPLIFGHLALGLTAFAIVVECPAEGQLARKWIIFALVQLANLLAVESFLFDLKISAQEELGRKLLHSEAYGFRGNLESLVGEVPRTTLPGSGWKEFRERGVIKSFNRLQWELHH
jgi:hypothetical protein